MVFLLLSNNIFFIRMAFPFIFLYSVQSYLVYKMIEVISNVVSKLINTLIFRVMISTYELVRGRHEHLVHYAECNSSGKKKTKKFMTRYIITMLLKTKVEE